MANTGMRVEQLKFDLWRLVLVPPHDNEAPTMKAALDYAKEKAYAQFRALSLPFNAPFILDENCAAAIDQKEVSDQLHRQISYSVVEFDPDNEDHVMIMFACKGEDEYV